MFTIKHVDSLGNEFAIEAESYEVAFEHQSNFVRIVTYDNKFRDGCYTGLWAGIPHDNGGPDVETIYVMNSRGSTIATHHFKAEELTAQASAQMAQAA